VYMYLDFVEHCEGARPSVFPAGWQPAACCASCVSCLPPLNHALPRPPEPRAAWNRSAWRAQGSSGKRGLWPVESAPEVGDPRRQRVQPPAQGEFGDFGTRAVRQLRACPPETPIGARLACRHRSPSGRRVPRRPAIRPRRRSQRRGETGWSGAVWRPWPRGRPRSCTACCGAPLRLLRARSERRAQIIGSPPSLRRQPPSLPAWFTGRTVALTVVGTSKYDNSQDY
jgi:hypothetical protein